MLICTKSSVAPYKSAIGSAPDSAGGAYSAPPDPLAGGEGAGCLLPKNLTSALGPIRAPALWAWILVPSGLNSSPPGYDDPPGSRGARINTAYTDADITFANW